MVSCMIINLRLVVVFCFVNVCLCLHSQIITRGPYLQMQTDSGIVVLWRTDIPSASQVGIGFAPGFTNAVFSDTNQVIDHRIQVFGLYPSRKYFYRAGDTQRWLSIADSAHYFRTAPPKGNKGPVNVWVIGDFGRGDTAETFVRDSYIRQTKNSSPADVWLWLGDNAYDNGTDQEFQDKVFDSIHGYHHVFANLPFWPTPGNHDYGSVNRTDDPSLHTGPYYDIVDVPQNAEVGGVPSHCELYYSFDYSDVHFISLNSELDVWITSQDSEMANWLKADLAANKKKWTIVYFHKPPYSFGSHNSDNFITDAPMLAMRTTFLPILEAAGVDLVLAGHSHVYERSFLIHGHYGLSETFNPGIMLVNGTSGNLQEGKPYYKDTIGPTKGVGTVYAVVGNSASRHIGPALNHPVMYAGYGCETCIGSMMINVSGDTLNGNYFSALDDWRDDFSIIKTAESVNPIPPAVASLDTWPNPFSEKLWVEVTLLAKGELTLEIFDSQGKLVKEVRQIVNEYGMVSLFLVSEILPLSEGVYMLKVSIGNNSAMRKIVRL